MSVAAIVMMVVSRRCLVGLFRSVDVGMSMDFDLVMGGDSGGQMLGLNTRF